MQKSNKIRFRKPLGKTRRDGTQNIFLELACTVLRLKAYTVSNLPKTNAAEINPKYDDMTETDDNFTDCSEKSLFSSVSKTPKHWKPRGKDIAK